MAVGGNGRFDPVDFLGGGVVPRWFQWPVVPYWTSSIDDNHYWLGHRRPISRIFLRLHQVRQGGLQHVSLQNCCNTSSSILLSRSRWECCQYFCAVLVCALPCLWPPACLACYFCREKITRLKRAKTIRCYLSVTFCMDICWWKPHKVYVCVTGLLVKHWGEMSEQTVQRFLSLSIFSIYSFQNL